MLVKLFTYCFSRTNPAADAPWAQAASNGKQARRALLACWRYVQGWLQHADPQSGLIPRNLSKDLFWNAKDAAADNYPFMVLSSYYTDHHLYSHRMHAMLKTEQRLCNRLGSLPDDYIFATHAQRPRKPSIKELIFGAMVYGRQECPICNRSRPHSRCGVATGTAAERDARKALSAEVATLKPWQNLLL